MDLHGLQDIGAANGLALTRNSLLDVAVDLNPPEFLPPWNSHAASSKTTERTVFWRPRSSKTISKLLHLSGNTQPDRSELSIQRRKCEKLPLRSA